MGGKEPFPDGNSLTLQTGPQVVQVPSHQGDEGYAVIQIVLGDVVGAMEQKDGRPGLHGNHLRDPRRKEFLAVDKLQVQGPCLLDERDQFGRRRLGIGVDRRGGLILEAVAVGKIAEGIVAAVQEYPFGAGGQAGLVVVVEPLQFQPYKAAALAR